MAIFNENNFEKWLKNTLKMYYGDKRPYIEELIHQFEESGVPYYVIAGNKTKSGNPEIYVYQVHFHFFDEDENEISPEENNFAYVITEFIL